MSRGRSLLLVLAIGALGFLAAGAGTPNSAGLPGLDAEVVAKRLAEGAGKQALALVEAALDRASREGSAPLVLAAAIQTLAEQFNDAGAAEESETLYRRALALRESVPGQDPAGLVGVLHGLSGLCFNRGGYAEAEALERRALKVGERALPAGDPSLVLSRRDLGLIFLTTGRLHEAEPLLTGALRTLEAAGGGDPFEVAVGKSYLAELYRLQSRYAEAGTLLERLVESAERDLGPDNPQTHYFMNNLAGIYRDEERFAEAETLLHRSLALRLAAAHPDEAAIARATLNLAELYRFQGKLDDAERLYVEALGRAERTYGAENPELFEFVNQLAVLQCERGRLERAEPLARRALALATGTLRSEDPRVAQSELDLGELLRSAGRCDEASPHFARAFSIRQAVFGADHPEVAVVLAARAPCDLHRDRAAALADLDGAIGILGRSVASPAVRIDALALRSQLLHASDPKRARADLASALRLVEELRPRRGGGEEVRAEFLGRHAGLYLRMVSWEIADGRVGSALGWAERARARSLLDQLAASGVGAKKLAEAQKGPRLAAARARVAGMRQRLSYLDSATGLDPAEVARERRGIEARLTEALREVRGLYDEARNASPAWRLATGNPATAEEIQRTAVPRGGLLLEYALGEEGGTLFLVPPPPGAPQALELRIEESEARALGVSAGPADGPRLQRALLGSEDGAGLLASLQTPPEGPTRGIGALAPSPELPVDRLQALFKVLVPVEAWTRIRAAREIVIVPDGVLSLLPFEALIVGRGGSEGVRFWLDDGPPIRYAPSGTLLREIGRRAPASSARTALSVYDPAYGPLAPIPGLSPLPALPGTVIEANQVRAALLGVASITTLSGAAASENAVRAMLPGRRWIHLATHGLVDERGGDLFAALAFALPSSLPARGDNDGLLELNEIYELKLDCELAVLSACRSNVGRRIAGEGVFALSRGFLVSGARRVVSSQWSVSDASAAEMIGALFQGIASAERAGRTVPYAVALRDAKRRLRHRPEFAHPFHWAAFVLTGLG